jgi:hypothetical protein
MIALIEVKMEITAAIHTNQQARKHVSFTVLT